MLLRWIAGGIGMPTMFFGLKFVPASKSTLIFNMNPLFIVIAAYLVLSEKIKKLSVFALIGAFVGVVVFNIHKNETKNVSDLYYFGISWAFVTCFCFTIVTLWTKIINRENHWALSPLYFGITTTSEAFSLLLIQLTFGIRLFNFSYYTYYDVSLFFLSGVLTYGGQAARSLALKYEEASYIAPVSYLQTLLLLICDLAFFGYVFNILDYTGATITLVWVLMPVVKDFYATKENSAK